MLPTAKRYLAAGLSVLPARRDVKIPALAHWKPYQKQLPDIGEVEQWFRSHDTGICLVTGQVSGHLEMIDFDHRAEAYPAWSGKIDPALLQNLVIEESQSGGRHVIYRCADAVAASMKLAQRPEYDLGETFMDCDREYAVVNGKKLPVRIDSEGRKYVILLLIETRGEGGQFLCDPTPGYKILQGDLCHLPVIRRAERDSLLKAALSLNQLHLTPVAGGRSNTKRNIEANGHLGEMARFRCLPGDDYNERGDLRTLLQQHGWRSVFTKEDGNEHWTRPGKKYGTSATLKSTEHGLRFYVFSSNAVPFEPNQDYSPFAVYAMLEHNGDFESAAKTLGQQGYGREMPTLSGVDLSGLLQSHDDELFEEDDEDDEDESLPKVEPVPNEYFRVPGFVGEVMDFCMRSAPYPVMGTAFCGAMALQAFLCSRKVREPGDLRPNLYLLALAGASGGKDQPRKINTHVMETIGTLNALADKLASGEGLLDSLFVQPTMLCQTDEIDGMIRSFNKPHNTNSETLFGTLLTLYSSSASSLPMRRKAGNTNPGVIVQPHFTLFGTATPKLYYKSLSEQLLTNGFFARTLILDIGKRPFGQDSIPVEQLPARVIETARWWQAFQPGEHRGNLAGFYPVPITVPMDDHAVKAFREFRHWADLEFGKAEDRNDEVAKTVWGRAHENAKKLALVYACSENHKDPKITLSAAKWAMQLCDHQVRRQLFLAREFAVKNDFDALLKEAIAILRAWHAKHGYQALMPPWKFKNALGIRPREHDEVVSELQARRIAVFESISTSRRPKIGFRLLKQ